VEFFVFKVRSRQSVMNLLLDFGANIHHVTNSGSTVIEICFAMYHCFVEKFNKWQDNDPSIESIFAEGPTAPPYPAVSIVLKSSKDSAVKADSMKLPNQHVAGDKILTLTPKSRIFPSKKSTVKPPAAVKGHPAEQEGKAS
jgi:hypothetical protein